MRKFIEAFLDMTIITVFFGMMFFFWANLAHAHPVDKHPSDPALQTPAHEASAKVANARTQFQEITFIESLTDPYYKKLGDYWHLRRWHFVAPHYAAYKLGLVRAYMETCKRTPPCINALSAKTGVAVQDLQAPENLNPFFSDALTRQFMDYYHIVPIDPHKDVIGWSWSCYSNPTTGIIPWYSAIFGTPQTQQEKDDCFNFTKNDFGLQYMDGHIQAGFDTLDIMCRNYFEPAHEWARWFEDTLGYPRAYIMQHRENILGWTEEPGHFGCEGIGVGLNWP